MSFLRWLVLAATGGRTFLGARWVRGLLALTPSSWRPGLALRLLGLAPHYFHGHGLSFRGHGLGSAAHRSRVSLEMFVRDVLEPYLAPEQDLLDVGCGPGYLTRAVAGRVWSVTALDVSRGVLSCARILNPAINIDYRTPQDFFGSGRRVDIAVSLDVATWMGDGELTDLLDLVWASLRPGGCLVLRTCVRSDVSGPGPGPGQDAEPVGRSTLAAGQSRLAHSRGSRRGSPHCHPRQADHLVGLVEQAGFGSVLLHALHAPAVESGPQRAVAENAAAQNCLLVAIRRYDRIGGSDRITEAAAQSPPPPQRASQPAARG
ncbi:class I SAM-dependent methyltransferase [Parafrankia sp. CH37]|uniref:class I SAM-dependent methyltransferase n=1 Tax=Parafrankia sp. CH37 TaxID=683308 RepID=UPI000B83E86B|nr:class I SAM-dependent methyltransferase [Parafrankia sp. CH37]MBE3199521.1 class I SAM-dependent methyltransferase [Parafrankia sp. CH37]